MGSTLGQLARYARQAGREPPKYKEQQERMQRWYECTTDEDYHRLGQEIWDFFAEDLTVIGTVAFRRPSLF